MEERNLVGERTWKAVAGFGTHLKSTPTHLTLHRGASMETVPLSRVSHLLIIGAHVLQSVVVTHCLRSGAPVTFFDADFQPVGTVRPYGHRQDERMRSVQEHAAPHRYAVEIAKASTKARLYAIEQTIEKTQHPLFLRGEYDVVTTALEELDYLVTLDEIRRVHRLITEMYYEIMARCITPEYGFSRRTEQPHSDPVNALLSLGYAILQGICTAAVIGAELDPDWGMLHQGKWALVRDLVEPLKPKMVDIPVFALSRAGIDPSEYEAGTGRCYLSDTLSDRCTAVLGGTIAREEIDHHVRLLCDALTHQRDYTVPYW